MVGEEEARPEVGVEAAVEVAAAAEAEVVDTDTTVPVPPSKDCAVVWALTCSTTAVRVQPTR